MNRSLCLSQRPSPYLAMCLLHVKLTVYAYFSVELCPLCVSLLPPLPLSPWLGFAGGGIGSARFLSLCYSWSALQSESEFHWASIVCSCVTSLTLLFKVTFQPSSLKGLHAAKFSNQKRARPWSETVPHKGKLWQKEAWMGCGSARLPAGTPCQSVESCMFA